MDDDDDLMIASDLTSTRLHLAAGAAAIGAGGVALAYLMLRFAPHEGRLPSDSTFAPLGLAVVAGFVLGAYGASRENGAMPGCLALAFYTAVTVIAVILGVIAVVG